MIRQFWRSLTKSNDTSQASDVPRSQGCWPCHLQNIPCSLDLRSTNGVCSVCQRFNMKCVGVGRDFPRDSGSKQAAKAIQQWIAHSANHNPDVPPLDLSYLVPLVVTIEAVAAQEALEGHANPPKSLTNSFDCAMQIARRAQDLGKFGTPLTLISNRAFATCRLLLFYVPPEGARLPPHPTERDYRNASILTTGLPVLSIILRQTSELLLKGPLDDTSAMEQALEIILACITQLGRSLEEARGSVVVDNIVEDIKSILGVKKTTTLPRLPIVGGDGVDTGLESRSDDGGTPGSSTFGLAPETREDETIMQNLEPSLPPTSSDPAGTGPRVFGGDGVDTGLESRSDDGGTPESSTFGLAPETREDETIVQNLEPSLPPTSSDPAETRPRVFGDDDLRTRDSDHVQPAPMLHDSGDSGVLKSLQDTASQRSGASGRDDMLWNTSGFPDVPTQPHPILPNRLTGARIAHLDIAVYGIAQGRLEIELYPTAPDDLASHFVGLCEGSFGVSYIGTGFFGVIPGVALWGGDIQLNNGQGNYIGIPQVHLPYPPLRLAGPGYLAGTPHPNGFGSQFTLTLDESGADHLRYGTVFGRVRNLESAIFNALQAVGGHGGSGTRSLPERLIQIIGCGVP